jgi:hypothetical protein
MRVLSLFDGTGSISRAFGAAGSDVVSLDIDGRYGATIVCDVRLWDYSGEPPFDVVFAGCPCEQYSIARTRAKTPRNYVLADELVATTWRIIQHFLARNSRLHWFVENPFTSQLWKRAVADPLWPRVSLSFCSYGAPYQKKTTIATNCTRWRPRPMCSRETCPNFGNHPFTAQKAPTRGKGVRDTFTRDQLHAYPPDLCSELAAMVNEQFGDDGTQ